MKKLVSLVLALAMCLVCFANVAMAEGVAKEDLKVGVIFIGDENEGYTAAHYEGIKAMMETLGLSD